MGFTYVEHVVLCKMTRMPTPSDVAKIQELASLQGVVSVVQGENYTTRGQGFNYGIVVRFTSKEAQARYQTAKLHVQVRDQVIVPLLVADTKVLALDFEHNLHPRLALLAIGFAAGLVIGVKLSRRS